MTPSFYKLDERVMTFMVDQLGGVNALGDVLALLIARSAGEFYALAPEGVTESRLYQFAQGGLLSEGVRIDLPEGRLVAIPNYDQVRARELRARLSADQGLMAIIDDANARWDESGEAETAFGVAGQLYHRVDWTTREEDIERLLHSNNLIWHGAVAICDASSTIQPGLVAQLEALRACAATAVEITCVAYDGESCVGWRRA